MSSLLISLRVPFLLIAIFLLWQFPAGGESGSPTAPEQQYSDVPGPVVLDENITELHVEVEPSHTDALVVIGSPNTESSTNYQLRFALWDGEKLTFALPDHVESLYTFERRGEQVFVSKSEVTFVDLAQAD